MSIKRKELTYENDEYNMIFKSEVKHLLTIVCSFVIKMLFPVKKCRVFFESFGGLNYSCNPKYITEKILNICPNHFQLVWAFNDPKSIKDLDQRIIKVKERTLKELYYLYTSEFVITNTRICNHWSNWKKRLHQKYIMTWHGSMALKRVEFDAGEHLPHTYMHKAEQDSKNIDLMLSDSIWCSAFCRNAFHYEGEILEKGLPRNDIFLQPNTIGLLSQKVRNYYQIKSDTKILLYAPTFRVDKKNDNYIFEWDPIIKALNSRFYNDFVIMIRLHPNMVKNVDTATMLTSDRCIDVTKYEDMQELLCAADTLITDYSSSMFDVALKQTPCFLYVPDQATYDRGFYFKIENLPFPAANSIECLKEQIISFDKEKYIKGLKVLFNNIFQTTQKPNSSNHVIEWMLSESGRLS